MQHRGYRPQPIAPKPKKLSKQYQWTLYLRQILFESRVVNLWLGYDQLCVAVALHRWRHHAAGGAPPPGQTIEASTLLVQTQSRMRAMESRIAELERENASLRTRAAPAPSPPKPEPSEARQQRRAESAQRRLEAALTSQLEAEEHRLRLASAQLDALRASVEEREEQMLERQARHLQHATEARLTQLGRYRRSRSARQAWLVIAWHARVVAAPTLHTREQAWVRLGFSELAAVQEGRDALGWRVKELTAQLIVLRGQSGEGGASYEADQSIWPAEQAPSATPSAPHQQQRVALSEAASPPAPSAQSPFDRELSEMKRVVQV